MWNILLLIITGLTKVNCGWNPPIKVTGTDSNGVVHPDSGFGVSGNPTNPLKDVSFMLYVNSSSTGEVLLYADKQTIYKSSFNVIHPTRIITHGWKGTQYSEQCTTIKDAYLARGNFNVIVVNWSKGAGRSDYLQCVDEVKPTGEMVAAFIYKLIHATEIRASNIHLVGFGLGAHVLGIAGRLINRFSGQAIHSAYGLNPSGPGFDKKDLNSMIYTDSAKYVEIIHTEIDYAGIKEALGTADFYANGGRNQPGCSATTCSHSRSAELFVESINTDKAFEAFSCTDFESLVNVGKCVKGTNKEFFGYTDGGWTSNYHLASSIYRYNENIYYFQTGEASPFSENVPEYNDDGTIITALETPETEFPGDKPFDKPIEAVPTA